MKYLTITEQDKINFGRMREDRCFLEKHKDELREKYPNRWVAVLNKKIAGVNEDFDVLLEELRKKNIDTGETIIEFLSTTEDIPIL